MHRAILKTWGAAPIYESVPALPPPGAGQLRLRVVATALHRVVHLRAAGTHPTARTLPVDPFVDGVGRDEATGALYYIASFAAPVAAEYANVDANRLFRLPTGADPVAVAALMNPVQSSWMALRTRVTLPLPPQTKDGDDKEDGGAGWTVLILGVTSTSGAAAVQVARHFGATRVIGAARGAEALDALPGLDQRVVIDGAAPDKTDFGGLGRVDVVLDYVYGPVASALFAALDAPPDRPDVQYVNIGLLSGTDAQPLSAVLLRTKALRITGAGPGSWSLPALGRELGAIVSFVAGMPRPRDAVERPLSDVESCFYSDEAKRKRLVMVP
jgi:NADPH:quinone reductase-like Zn-dependent oxidoreductase